MGRPTEDQMDQLANEVTERIDEGGSRFPGLSYEEGIRDALDWARGFNDNYPYPED